MMWRMAGTLIPFDRYLSYGFHGSWQGTKEDTGGMTANVPSGTRRLYGEGGTGRIYCHSRVRSSSKPTARP